MRLNTTQKAIVWAALVYASWLVVGGVVALVGWFMRGVV